jgi:hypothetical protein
VGECRWMKRMADLPRQHSSLSAGVKYYPPHPSNRGGNPCLDTLLRHVWRLRQGIANLRATAIQPFYEILSFLNVMSGTRSKMWPVNGLERDTDGQNCISCSIV